MGISSWMILSIRSSVQGTQIPMYVYVVCVYKAYEIFTSLVAFRGRCVDEMGVETHDTESLLLIFLYFTLENDFKCDLIMAVVTVSVYISYSPLPVCRFRSNLAIILYIK